MSVTKRLLMMLLLSVLGACTSPTALTPPCCYVGQVTLAHLDQLKILSNSGQLLNIQQVLPGFKPQTGFFTATLPLHEVNSEDVVYASLEPLFPIYDSNRNGTLEEPEITLLYLREAIRGFGIHVAQIGSPEPVHALTIPDADTGGMVNYVQTHHQQLSVTAQKIFADLELLGNDLLSRGSEGGAEGQGSDRIN